MRKAFLLLLSFALTSSGYSESLSKDATALRGKIESVTRSVEVMPSGGNGWKKAGANAPLATADKIRTGKRSVARVKLGDGSKVLLLQNSQAEIEKLSSVQKTIKLLRGRVRAIVAKIKGGNNFHINTPVGVASVRGTDFEVEVSEDGQSMLVEVNEGQVGVAKLGELSNEVVLNPGDHIKFGIEGEIGDPIRSGSIPMNNDDFRSEIQNTNAKQTILAMAAEESRQADYQVGKSLIDAYGHRVRVEEYIMRPAADQFKLVVLNERPNRFDYFTYKGTFNTSLPDDLSIALREVNGKLGTAPTYFLKEYQTEMSNTIDKIGDSASGGHLVKITISPDDDSKYRLIDSDDATHYRDVDIATLLSDGSYKIYNPIRDTFSVVSAADKDDAIKMGILDSVSGDYRNFASDDTFWRTRFNTYSSFVNTTAKMSWAPKSSVTNTLAVDLDANFTNSPLTTTSEFPLGTTNLQNKLSLYYQDGSQTTYTNTIIDDEGNVAPTSAFDGKSSSAAYKEELEKWNYEQRVTSTEMGSRYIDIVVDPKIGTKSGLIQ